MERAGSLWVPAGQGSKWEMEGVGVFSPPAAPKGRRRKSQSGEGAASNSRKWLRGDGCGVLGAMQKQGEMIPLAK